MSHSNQVPQNLPNLPTTNVPAQGTHCGGGFESAGDPRQLILAHTLSITTAETVEQLVARTLAAACEMTGAALAAAIDPDGGLRTHGDPEFRERLAVADPTTRHELLRRPGGITRALAGLGLPSAVTAFVGETVLVIAHPVENTLCADAGSVLALLTAHTQTCLVRLHELDWLHHRANSDPLTGLRHHRPFEERLGLAVPGRTAVVAIDVDGFKKINDRYGHQAGDRVLIALVDALRSALRESDEFYRIGGDEFAVVLEVNGEAEAAAIAQRLLIAARRSGHSISVGAALNTADETGRETLRRADEALYQAKRAGRNTARLAA